MFLNQKILGKGKQRNDANPVHVGEEEIRMLRRLLELPPHRLRVLRKQSSEWKNTPMKSVN